MTDQPPPNQTPFHLDEALPDDLPASPMPTVHQWLDHATRERVQPNPNAMTLATVDPDGRPSARIVLCKGLDPDHGFITFYTNKDSRKGAALRANPHAALILHWDALDRQARIEGPVLHAPDHDADAYFASRHPASRLGAWASDQSKPIDSRADLLAKVMHTVQRLGLDMDHLEQVGKADIPRPPHWGGYRVWAERVELWVGSPVRIHDRAVWTRTLTQQDEHSYAPETDWAATRLQP